MLLEDIFFFVLKFSLYIAKGVQRGHLQYRRDHRTKRSLTMERSIESCGKKGHLLLKIMYIHVCICIYEGKVC